MVTHPSLSTYFSHLLSQISLFKTYSFPNISLQNLLPRISSNYALHKKKKKLGNDMTTKFLRYNTIIKCKAIYFNLRLEI